MRYATKALRAASSSHRVHRSAKEKSLTHPDVITISRLLDRLVNEYLKKQKE
ncbi:aspartyl-phosphate phosphatase Spo0E family protein [Aneurinibacillus sp. BA2021]|nr:aspartyl-phosphate phosphatase Spo0E family protein [Aneurinibacillus sp. BA2021]